METVIDFFNMVVDQAGTFGDTLDAYWERALYWIVIAYLKIKLIMMESAWGIAKTLIEGLGISAVIDSAWSSLDSQLLQAFTYLRIPESLNMLLNAYVTRFVMGMMP